MAVSLGLLLFPVVLSSTLNSTRSKACLELVKYRLTEDELDIEDCLQLQTHKEALLDYILVTHLLHCSQFISQELVEAVVTRLPGLYLTPLESEFLHLPILNCSLPVQVNVTSEDRKEYEEILSSAKDYDSQPFNYQGWSLIIGMGICVCGGGLICIRRLHGSLPGLDRKTV